MIRPCGKNVCIVVRSLRFKDHSPSTCIETKFLLLRTDLLKFHPCKVDKYT